MEFANVLACAVLCFCAQLPVSRSADYDPSAADRRDGGGGGGGGISISQQQQQQLSRQKRALVYPTPSTLLLIFGLGTPLQLQRESVIVGAFAKLIYALPTNATDFTEPAVLYGRESSNGNNNSSSSSSSSGHSRWSLYKAVSRLASLYGFGDGRSCLLLAICELASSPFDLRHGLLQQLLQTFFSPSSTGEKYDEYSDREYHAAESLGRAESFADAERCHALYPDCRRSFLDVFTAVGRYLQHD